MSARAINGGLLIVVGTIVSEVHWSERTAEILSRFLSPHYIAGLLLLSVGLSDPDSWQRGVLWAAGVALVGVVVPLLIVNRELHKGGISDWFMSNRLERLRRGPLLAVVTATALPLALLAAFDGPRPLLATFVVGTAVAVFNVGVTMWWKVSQHVTMVAASATIMAMVVGVEVAPALLLIPLVAWARVKARAHTLMQTVVGGGAGACIAWVALRLCGIG